MSRSLSRRAEGSESPPLRPGGATKTDQMRSPKEAWLIIALLFLFMVINFADKAVIGIAAVPIMQELKLSPSQFGLIGSSFFLLFSVSAIVTGFIVNRVQTRWALLIMGLVWALTQFPMLGTVGFATIVACRIALGAGEGPAAPVALHSAYKWFPNEVRTLPTAIVVQGGGIGIHGGIAAAQLGHRPLFLALGLWCARDRRSRLGGGVGDPRPRGLAYHCRSYG